MTNAADAVGVAPATDMVPTVTDLVVAVIETPAKVVAPLEPVACDCRFVADCAVIEGGLLVAVPLPTVSAPETTADKVPTIAVPDALEAVRPAASVLTCM